MIIIHHNFIYGNSAFGVLRMYIPIDSRTQNTLRRLIHKYG